MADTKYPDKPMQSWVPKSMRDSGANLDLGCGDIEQAEGGSTETYGSDAIALLNKEKP
jgi:hypothetical protein